MIAGLKEKFGFWDQDTVSKFKSSNDCLWFHGVSVGELNAIWPLVCEIHKKVQNPIVISTTTKAGHKHAKNLIGKQSFTLIFFPFDFLNIIRKIFSYTKIKAIIIAESEIWPNLINMAHKKNIKIIAVNAKISDRSFKNYKLLRIIFNRVFAKYDLILTQSETDKVKFLALNAHKERVKNIGNIKFAEQSISQSLNFSIDKGNNIFITFASTHPGEEELALRVFKEIIKSYKNIRLIIAPRHIERRQDVYNIVLNTKFNPILRSTNTQIKNQQDIFILDSIGELTSLYKVSDITVLCGSFVPIGGHNILEPIRAGSYTIIGPYDFKTKELTKPFIESNAITQVQDENDLLKEINKVINNERLKDIKIAKGKEILNKNANILEQYTNEIIKLL